MLVICACENDLFDFSLGQQFWDLLFKLWIMDRNIELFPLQNLKVEKADAVVIEAASRATKMALLCQINKVVLDLPDLNLLR